MTLFAPDLALRVAGSHTCITIRVKSIPKVKSDFVEFVRVVVSGNIDEVSRRLAVRPSFAIEPAAVGASRQDATDFFFTEIAHYLYAGDTALHMAAAAFRYRVAEILVVHGADCSARNRRGAQPLHYAADANHWDPASQAKTIEYLLSVGADPNAIDASGVSPLHRAVRTRSCPAVRALLDGGASPRGRNKAGSTPLHLAVQTTGRGESGSEHARQQQTEIIKLLLERGASPADKDGKGKTVRQAATSEWIRMLLVEGNS
ncbi:MAG: uncharacterized protein QOK37_3202 [Thermoanaerobaculia bacterium]|jgi:hypothetical protein|nr:uncharacterized protein [Thermoanaerobaculia bacterium]